MSLLVKMTLSAALVLSIGVPFGAFAAGEKTKGRYKTALGVNVFLFFGTMIAAAAFMFSGNAFAAEETAAAASNSAAGMGYLSAALATGLSCLGGGIAVSAAASAALGAISEDSSILGKSLIFVGLAEGVCLYGLIISFMILLTEKFGREFPEIIDNVKLERKLPLIVEIPDRHGTGRKPDFITSYVNEAIGLKL